MTTKTSQGRGRGSSSSDGPGFVGELESFAAGWAADRIRSLGERARNAGRDDDRQGGDDQDEGHNGDGRRRGGGGGGAIESAMQSGLAELKSGASPLSAAGKAVTTGVSTKVKQVFSGKGGSGGSKVINIIEDLDVGVPVDVAWKEWNNFRKFNGYMKGVDSAERVAEDKVNFRAKVAWSHRSWESKITDEVENERIAWKSKGSKGSVDGVITFHELGPNLTKMLVVLEYHPAGFFEKTGNLWRAQGRRARLDLKHFRRYVTSRYAHGDGDEDEGGDTDGGQQETEGRDRSERERARNGRRPSADEEDREDEDRGVRGRRRNEDEEESEDDEDRGTRSRRRNQDEADGAPEEQSRRPRSRDRSSADADDDEEDEPRRRSRQR